MYEHKPDPKRVIDAAPAYLTVNMLQDVLTSGTAGGMGIGRPAAGKTGTTDTFIDAWFVGFTPQLSTAVWVGDDNNRPMHGMYGSSTPLSIWHDFMINALASVPASGFVNPGVTVPPEPEIKNEDKDKDKDKDKKKNENDKSDKNTPEETSDKPIISNTPSSKKKSLKERVKDIIGEKDVISNKPTPKK